MYNNMDRGLLSQNREKNTQGELIMNLKLKKIAATAASLAVAASSSLSMSTSLIADAAYGNGFKPHG